MTHSNKKIPALLKSCVNAVTDYLIDVRICLNGFNHAKYDKNICNVHKYNELMKKSGGGKIEDYKGKTSKDFSLLPDGSFACGDISDFRRPMFKGSDIWDDFFRKQLLIILS